MKNRAIIFWLIGAFLIFLAMAAATGARGDSSIFAYVASFLLTLAGGMFWISIMHMDEEKKK
jgi:hypothetical protein